MRKIHVNSERGVAAVIAVLMVGVMTLLGLSAMSTSDDEVSIAGNELHEMRSFYAAEAGLNTAVAAIQTQYEATGLPPTSLPAGELNMNGTTITYNAIDNGPAVVTKVSSGSLTGMSASVKSYTVQSTAHDNHNAADVTTSMQFQLVTIPIIEFGVFYQNELLLSPTFAWTISGRVHTNGHAWLQGFGDVKFTNHVSAAGNVYHGLPNGQFSVTATSDVYFKDAAANYQTMKVGGSWLDATNPDWYAKASARWSGYVRDLAFGERPLKISLSGTSDAHKLIDRELGNPNSYEAKASLKFIDNKAYKLVGAAWVEVTADMTAKGIISYGENRFYDERQGKWVDVLDLDLSALNTKGYDPTNGILYYSSTEGDYPALRLISGTQIGKPMTIASRNPMYTQGNINSNNTKPLALISDGFTVLSSDWSDANSALLKVMRKANVNITVSAAIVTGDVAWTATNYQGGLENLPSLLESWQGAKTLTISGSFASLWRSQQAIGEWSTLYYDPPKRAYSFNENFKDAVNHPPSVPTVVTVLIAQWAQEDVGL